MEIFSGIVEQLATLADSVIGVCLINGIFENKTRKKWWHIITASVLGYVVVILLEQYYWLPIIAMFLVLLVYSFIFFKGSILKKAAVNLIFQIGISVINGIGIQTIALLFNKDIDVLVQSASWSRIVLLVFVKVLLFVSVKAVIKLISKTTNIYSSAIGLGVLLLSFIISTILCKFSGDMSLNRKQQYEILGMEAGIIILNIFTTIIVYRLQAAEEKIIEASALKNRIEYEKQLLRKITEKDEEVREIKHDSKHYYSIIRNYIERNELQKVCGIIDGIVDKIESGYVRYISNQVINGIINEKKQICINKNIEMKVVIIGDIEFDAEIDTGIIMSNLLDNSIREAEKHENGIVALEISSVENVYRIVISNTIKNSVLNDNPDFYTTKKDNKNHGFGIKSVKHILNEKNGTLNIKEEDGKIVFEIIYPKKELCVV